MTATIAFIEHRTKHPKAVSWTLAWYLANEFCKRFYSSHGIVPHVIDHDGLGYYGIQLDYMTCPVNVPEHPALGRMTAMGNVENWRPSGPGDHRLELTHLYREKIPSDKLTELAIKHMRVPALPDKTHLNCRHKRWGDSYKLMFEIATILAIREKKCRHIWNHPYHTERLVQALDPQANMKEHPGAFLFISESSDRQVVITGDGRVLRGGEGNLWERYMKGESALSMVMDIEAWL